MKAREAWKATRADRYSAFDDWRHEQVQACVNLGGLSELKQKHYSAVKAHFLALAGKAGQAFNSAMKSEDEERRQWFFKLTDLCREAGIDLAYPRKIAQTKYKNHVIEDLTVTQLQHLYFSCQRRAGKNEKQEYGGGIQASGVLDRALGAIKAKAEAARS